MSARTKALRTSLPRLLCEASKVRESGPPPRVSVIIPTYGRASLLPRTIESVLRQTFADFELIVVDDASPDDTAAAVGRFDDHRLRYMRLPKNRGQWHAENVGIAYARGEWVAFLDDDDEWLPDKLEKQLAHGERTGSPVVYCGARRVTGADAPAVRVARPQPEGDVSQVVLTPRMPSTPTVYMVRRDALVAVGGFDESLAGAQDRDLWIRLALAGRHFAVVQEALALYHEEHPGRKMEDPVLILRSMFVHKRRWGRLKREAMGADAYKAWLERRDRESRRVLKKHVRRIERSGSRSDAWRYVRRMTAVWPWGAALYSRMLAVVAFGRLPYRLSQVRKGKTGAPWLRRLFGAG